MNAPWFNAPIDNQRWAAASNHKGPIKEAKIAIEAFVLIQDCNMGGKYYRVIGWEGETHRRYFDISDDGDMWVFDVPFGDMKPGSQATFRATGLKYVVSDKSYDQYVRILTRETHASRSTCQ
jgi:hypothetical protein